ncbi:MAG: TonB family protein [Tidjanibacter sp.]|nr:TonB family protein [Tidjanibacter sp.]
MKESLQYLFEMLVCSGLFALLYHTVIRGRTTYRTERLWLVGTSIAAAVIPLLAIPLWPAQTVFINVPVVEASTLEVMEIAERASRISISDVATAIYIIGIVVGVVMIVVEIAKTLRQKRGAESATDGRIKIYTSSKVLSPHSLFCSLYLPDGLTDEERRIIVLHETVHIGHHHSVERLLMGLLRALLWINPFIWLAQRQLSEVEEFEVDRELLDRGEDLTEYRKLIIKQLFGCNPDIASGLGNSLTKKRFIMMTKTRESGRGSLLRALTIVPAATLLIAAFGCTRTDAQETQEANEKLEEVVVVTYGDTEDSPEAIDRLILVDGEVCEDMSEISSDIISSVTLLSKGLEDYVARYGEKAKNGVMIVETKAAAATKGESRPASEEVKAAWEGRQFASFNGGGVESFLMWIQQNVIYPADALEAQASGRVVVSFVVDVDGSVVDAKVESSPHQSLSDEVMRLMNKAPKWTPATDESGNKVSTKFMLPVAFALK